MDVHGEVQLVADDLLVLAGEFVSAVDALGVPVSPIEAVLEHGDGKRVWQACGEGEAERQRGRDLERNKTGNDTPRQMSGFIYFSQGEQPSK